MNVDVLLPVGGYPGGRMQTKHLFAVSAYWFATNLHWMALLQIIMPHQVARITPERQALALSVILGVGSFIALVMPPIVGAYSDRCASRWGRRRPFIAVGVVTNLAGLVLLFWAGSLRNIWLYLLGYIIVQFGNNIASAAYSGVIPDIVPVDQRGIASGWMAAMTQTGTVVGAFSAGILVGGGNILASYLLIGITLILFAGITLYGVREKPLETSPAPLPWRALLKGFWIDPRRYPDFAWVWITRFLFTLGMWMVQPFVQYYLRDVVGVENPAEMTGYLLGIALVGATFTGLLGGRLSDRIGRKRVVYVANALMAATSIAFLFGHNMTFVFGVAVFYGLAFGAYYSVDWALGCDVLPNKENAAKDMGVWHISMVLPQSFAPFISGLMLSACGFTKTRTATETIVHYNMMGYTVIFTFAAVFLVLSAVLLRNVKGAR